MFRARGIVSLLIAWLPLFVQSIVYSQQVRNGSVTWDVGFRDAGKPTPRPFFSCLSLLLGLLAQNPVSDSISATSGWVGTGLLGAVLSWLLFVHLPGKDKQLKELMGDKDGQLKALMESKDKAVEALLNQQWANLQRMEVAYRGDLKLVAEHCKTELEAVTYQFNQELATFHELMGVLKAFVEPQYRRRHPDSHEAGG